MRDIGGAHLDEGLALHHLIGESFGPGTLQPFRLMVAPGARTGSVYAYAGQSANDLATAARAVMDPAVARVVNLEALASQPRPASAWFAGQRLGFDLRVRPVVQLASALSTDRQTFRKGAELDAALAQTLRQDTPTDRLAVYTNWLRKRLEPAVALQSDHTRLVRIERRSITRNGRRINGPDATFHGTLAVKDPNAFAELLTRGVGRHRSYGYGMLLLRPPQTNRTNA